MTAFDPERTDGLFQKPLKFSARKGTNVCKLFTTQAQMHYSELPNSQYNRSETWTG